MLSFNKQNEIFLLFHSIQCGHFFYFVHIQFVMTKSTLFIIFPTSTLHIMQIISSELALRAESQICITIARDVLYCTLLLHNSSTLQDIIPRKPNIRTLKSKRTDSKNELPPYAMAWRHLRSFKEEIQTSV